jgi:hypothetical protein
MRHQASLGFGFLVVIGLLHPSAAAVGLAQSDCARCDVVVGRVRKLLPRQPSKLVVIDAERISPALQQRIARSEGLAASDEKTIYLKKQGSTFQRALAGPGIWDYVLAIIVWHEMAHLDGADECQAQEELWYQFVVERRVDGYRGLNYLRLLQKRQCRPLEESIGRG